MTHMFVDGTNYWCSNALAVNADCWVIFDCGDYELKKIEIKFQASYAAAIVKVFSSESRRTSKRYWEKITQKKGMTQDGTVKTILIRNDELSRYIKLKFENWINGYVGVERIHFFVEDE